MTRVDDPEEATPTVTHLTGPGELAGDAATTLAAGAELIERDAFAVFLMRLTSDGRKVPYPSCGDCPRHGEIDLRGARHDGEACEHLFCHGFYAATMDIARLEQMLCERPDGLLAVRTGTASRLAVLDAERTADRDGELTGLDVLDRWDELHSWSLPPTRTARSRSGGRHLYYRLPAGVAIRSRPRVAGAVDVKADGGYVGAPPTGGYSWLNDDEPLALASGELLTFLRTAPGRRVPGGGTRWRSYAEQAAAGEWVDERRLPPGPAGYDFEEYRQNGAPAGARDEFLNELAFRLRRSGVPRDVALPLIRDAFERIEQPSGDRYRWDDAVEKLDRVYATVIPASEDDPDKPVEDAEHERPGIIGGSAPPSTSGPRPAVTAPVDDNRGARTRAASVAAVGADAANPQRATDRANGVEVARWLDGRALWVPEARRDWQWFVHDGRRWVADRERFSILLVGEYTDELRRLATSGTLSNDHAEALLTRANRLETLQGLRAALAFAEPLLACPIGAFDADPWLLNCPNGTLDLRTGELRPHDPRDLLTRITPTPYDPTATDATWERVLTSSTGGDPVKIQLLQRFAGYSLTGDVGEKAFLALTGPRDTGK